jgi:hypothetical protein
MNISADTWTTVQMSSGLLGEVAIVLDPDGADMRLLDADGNVILESPFSGVIFCSSFTDIAFQVRVAEDGDYPVDTWFSVGEI